MSKIAIFYHALFCLGSTTPSPNIVRIVDEQMAWVKLGGLLDNADEFIVGINGGSESVASANKHLPAKAKQIFHGLMSKSEVPTIAALQKWLPSHPDWSVLYFHTKGASYNPPSAIAERWRRCMMTHLVLNWKRCISDLSKGYESVGCHWYHPYPTQHYFAGNFWWATAAFLKTLPRIDLSLNCKTHGIGHPGARWEAEVFLCKGPKLPRYKDYHPNWNFNCP